MDEYEEIPWSTLLTEHRQGRAKTVYLAAAVIVAVVAGFVGVRWLTAPGHGEQPALAAPIETTTTEAVVAETESSTTTAVLSEADLMAVVPAVAELAAIARAEWFVTDYFTVDGPIPEELISAFVNDATVPDLPNGDGKGGCLGGLGRLLQVPNKVGILVITLERLAKR